MIRGYGMNVYDFDGTIYDGDSSIDLYFYCIKKKPSVFFKSIPTQLSGLMQYSLKRISKEKYKEKFFSFLKNITADREFIDRFWDDNYHKIKQWYLDKKKSDDVIISASPEFLLKPVCERLGAALIASEVDASTGRFSGNNCRGQEKVIRFKKEFPDETIYEFYTDSLSDLPLAEISEKPYIVKKQTVKPFVFGSENGKRRNA